MNQRIEEIMKALELQLDVLDNEDGHKVLCVSQYGQPGILSAAVFEAAIKLAVAECADHAAALSKLYTSEATGYDVGYTMGTQRCANDLRAQFEVE